MFFSERGKTPFNKAITYWFFFIYLFIFLTRLHLAQVSKYKFCIKSRRTPSFTAVKKEFDLKLARPLGGIRDKTCPTVAMAGPWCCCFSSMTDLFLSKNKAQNRICSKGQKKASQPAGLTRIWLSINLVVCRQEITAVAGAGKKVPASLSDDDSTKLSQLIREIIPPM